MGAAREYQISASVVTMEHKLAVVGITSEWGVEVNGLVYPDYSPEQAVCIAGLIQAIDTPQLTAWLRSGLQQLDLATNGSLSKIISPESKELDAVLEQIGGVGSPIADNYFRIGKGTTKVALLLSNVADYDSADERLADYFVANPDHDHIEHTTRGTFRTVYLDRERAMNLRTPRKQTVSHEPAETQASKPSALAKEKKSVPVPVVPPQLPSKHDLLERAVPPVNELTRKDYFDAVKAVVRETEPGGAVDLNSLPQPKDIADRYQVENILRQGGYIIVEAQK
jgi:hypothetical protein